MQVSESEEGLFVVVLRPGAGRLLRCSAVVAASSERLT